MCIGRTNNRNVIFCIRRVQEGVKPSGPGRNFPTKGEEGTNNQDTRHDDCQQSLQKDFELLRGHLRSQVINKLDDLGQPEHSKCL